MNWAAWTFGGSLVFGTWALLNMALLAQFRGARSRIAETGDLLSVPISAPPPPPFQFSLRSMFVLTVLVALGSALGTRPLPTYPSLSAMWTFQSNGMPGLLCVGVVGYDSGTPAVGYLWRTVGKEPHGPEGRIVIGLSSRQDHYIAVDGVAVQPSGEFQLFVNDLHNNPMRLVIPRGGDGSLRAQPEHVAIEKFWNEVVEPQRRIRPPRPLAESSRHTPCAVRWSDISRGGGRRFVRGQDGVYSASPDVARHSGRMPLC